mmetsp:Transcript_43102/g.91860  ORF Transcript_43102/g.91860 Transcript_43102/m.91860 type:complete len:400 (+) Transcript_43102:83-1282(+)
MRTGAKKAEGAAQAAEPGARREMLRAVLTLMAGAPAVLVLQILALLRLAVQHCARLLQKPGPSADQRALRTPEARFAELPDFRYKPAYFEHGPSGCRVAYLDEGPRDAPHTVVLVHGDLSWSFAYRRVLKGLIQAGHRCVALDFIGFGRSDKPSSPGAYCQELHMDTLRALLAHLGLRGVTLALQGSGALGGLAVLPSLSPDTCRALVVMNAGLPPGERGPLTSLRGAASAMPFLLWRSIAELFQGNLPVGQLIQLGTRRHLSPAELAGYEAPFPESRFAQGAWAWSLMVPLGPSHPAARYTARAAEYLRDSFGGHALVLFSADPMTRPFKDNFASCLGRGGGIGAVRRIRDVRGGHFLQDDLDAGEVAGQISKFLARIDEVEAEVRAWRPVPGALGGR